MNNLDYKRYVEDIRDRLDALKEIYKLSEKISEIEDRQQQFCDALVRIANSLEELVTIPKKLISVLEQKTSAVQGSEDLFKEFFGGIQQPIRKPTRRKFTIVEKDGGDPPPKGAA